MKQQEGRVTSLCCSYPSVGEDELVTPRPSHITYTLPTPAPFTYTIAFLSYVSCPHHTIFYTYIYYFVFWVCDMLLISSGGSVFQWLSRLLGLKARSSLLDVCYSVCCVENQVQLISIIILFIAMEAAQEESKSSSKKKKFPQSTVLSITSSTLPHNLLLDGCDVRDTVTTVKKKHLASTCTSLTCHSFFLFSAWSKHSLLFQVPAKHFHFHIFPVPAPDPRLPPQRVIK